ncbi:unnamed protein product [marine sediment metagenome]|uniref:HTH arsR-type domain-containing protein n=1 Tax=marine sediment metagenome TaxID=412755 RepID=X1ES09_9ZZZZ
MNKIDALKKVFKDTPNIKILEVLMTGKKFTGRSIQKSAHVGFYTAKKVLEGFEEIGLIHHWEIGKTHVYQIDEESEIIKLLEGAK